MGALRIFLAVSVVIWHIPQKTVTWLHASIAVLLFFVISGFYMAMVVNEKYAGGGEGWRHKFYMARFFRIFPAYLVLQLVMVVWFLYTDTPTVFSSNLDMPVMPHALLSALNIFIAGQDVFQIFSLSIQESESNPVVQATLATMPKDFFDDHWMLVGQAWSLSSELFFYLLAPFIVLSLRRIVCLVAISLTIRWGLLSIDGFSSQVWGYHFFPATLCFFLLGSLGYHLYARIKNTPVAGAIGCVITVILFLIPAIEIFKYGGFPPIEKSTGYDTPILWAGYILFAVSLPFLFNVWKDNSFDRWIGEISYPLYLVHGLVIGVFFNVVRVPTGSLGWEIIVVLTSALIAGAVYLLVDRPIDAWRHRRFVKRSCQVDSGFKNYAIYPISILCLCALLIAHATLLSQFASPRASPAVLITVEKEHQFNIVKFDGRFFGVPFGVPISWGAPSYDSDSRLIIAASQDEVKSRIRDQGIRQVQTPILTFVDKEHQFNIVKFDGRFFGVPFGVPITWGAPRYDSDSRLIIAASQDEVESRIRDQGTRQGQTPILTFVDKEHQFNIVKFDGRFFGVPFGVPITWGAPGYDADPRLIIAVTQGEAASRIISRQAEKEMASRPKR